ncbi:unnamed protein product [Arabidopsis thaliana]|uniref:Uncharacterized protein n=1 Tax=Arabidopsis thaliana TaxID=3702 RepID=Q9LJ80_ARATH|nr:unnamed protein product [Arabidopsis thaliana]
MDIQKRPKYDSNKKKFLMVLGISRFHHITRPPGRVSSPPPPDHHSITPLDPEVEYLHLHYQITTRSSHSTKKSSISITTTRLPTRWRASESSPFRTQPDTRAQGRKEDSSYSLDLSLDHRGRVQFLIRPNTASF